MKLTALLKDIRAFRINTLGADCKSPGATCHEKAGHTPDDMHDATLADSVIGSIHYRAQEVQPGGMFVAIVGQIADGHDFMQQALQRGAAAMIAQKEPPQPFLNEIRAAPPKNRPIVIRVSDTRKALADLAARYFGHPSRDMILVGITGTNG